MNCRSVKPRLRVVRFAETYGPIPSARKIDRSHVNVYAWDKIKTCFSVAVKIL